MGTLGCFVRRGGRIFLLSNNHVIAGNNEGKKGDRILNPGSCFYDKGYQIAVLDDFSELKGSSPGALPDSGAIFNEIDAAVAELDGDVPVPSGAYLGVHTNMAPPRLTTGFVLPGEPVRKVGRTTGPTHGKVTGVKMQAGPIYYEGLGPCWFGEAIEIEGSDFCDTGDSGSVVMDSSDCVIGLLFATNRQQSYCCPIENTLQALNVAML